MKLKLLAAAVGALGVAFAGAASATNIISSSTAAVGSTLFLTVWKTTGDGAPVSYNRALGINLDTMIVDPATGRTIESSWVPEGGVVYDKTDFAGFAGEKTFTDTFSSGDNVFWTITSGKTAGVTTVVTTLPTVGTAPTSTQFTTLVGDFGGYIGQVNALADDANSPTTVKTTTSTASQAFGGNTTLWGARLGQNLPADNSARVSETLGAMTDAPFYVVSGAGFDAFNNSGFTGYWELMTNGDVRYTIAAVPEPSTWALLAAGLLGLGAIARRRAG